MPFLRFSRDKRGYEHTYLIHTGSKRGSGARILYWYRTPPGVKVGRVAFDDEVRRALEAQYPTVEFDWERLVNTPVPGPDAEYWRERRKAEKAARLARRAAQEEGDDEDAAEPGDPGQEDHASVPDDSAAGEAPSTAPAPAGASPDLTAEDIAEGGALERAIPPAAGQESPADARDAQQRRRRRRGGRRRRRPDRAAAPSGPPSGPGAPAAPLDASGFRDEADAPEDSDGSDGPDGRDGVDGADGGDD